MTVYTHAAPVSIFAAATVYANTPRNATPVVLQAGQIAKVSAAGVWLCNPHGDEGWCGPNGNGIRCDRDGHREYPVHDNVAFEGCLILYCGDRVAYIGPTGEPAEISGPGQLYLGPNDDRLYDNDGQLAATIEVRRI